jgi:P-type E1-E2 ATPase
VLSIDIPGFGDVRLEHLVLDFNGTLAVDGTLLPGVAPLLRELSGGVRIHVVTGDTFGSAAREIDGLPVDLVVLDARDQADAKLQFVDRLGRPQVAAIGNGRNDRKMLAAAAIGIAVVQREGAAAESASAADIVAPGIVDALELFTHPLRLKATLRG